MGHVSRCYGRRDRRGRTGLVAVSAVQDGELDYTLDVKVDSQPMG
ncbi:hypothetical protein [Actinophytocola algeriensis]|uniref:Uncharacterized protein n=1 Tax=Actinophytocola algeriensis TaxID=1768010 RepID=A0A7W7VIL0_9PSEU|nr:hypothetical protein [Actinophytocola algeriensis]MBB4911160.1 hypothetical protein [Actinophytocola algeriensis]MBE1479099.1 hypothetical protein [Actinophytocola algeriensis]